MIIDEKLLRLYGGREMVVKNNEILFQEGQEPDCYYQIVKGRFKVINSEEKSDFIHSFIGKGECIGEEFVLTQKPYSLTAIAIENSLVISLHYFDFIEILNKYSVYSINLLQLLSQRMLFKNMMIYAISSTDPKIKIVTLLFYIKNIAKQDSKELFKVPLSRQEIANMIGIRVETVIRIIRNMEKNKELQIIKGKIFL